MPPLIDLMILSSSTPPTLLIVTFGCAAWNRWSALVKMPSSRPVKPLHTVSVTGALELSDFDGLLLEELQAATALTATHKIASCFLICPPWWCERTRPDEPRGVSWRGRLAVRRRRRARSRRHAAASGAGCAARARYGGSTSRRPPARGHRRGRRPPGRRRRTRRRCRRSAPLRPG